MMGHVDQLLLRLIRITHYVLHLPNFSCFGLRGQHHGLLLQRLLRFLLLQQVVSMREAIFRVTACLV